MPVKVAICTERVEAKVVRLKELPSGMGCNLHGACGGKVYLPLTLTIISQVAICTERVEAKMPM